MKKRILSVAMAGALPLVISVSGYALDLPWDKDGAGNSRSGEQDQGTRSGTKDIVADEPVQKPAVRGEAVTFGAPPPMPAAADAVVTEKEYLKRGLDAEDAGERIAHFSRAIEVNPASYDAYYYRAVVYHAGGHYELAIADFSHALGIRPESSVAYNNRGVAYHQMKKYDLAISDFSKAIELNPSFGEAYNNRGVALRSKGDSAGARRDYERAVQLDPTDEMAQMNLERIRKKGR